MFKMLLILKQTAQTAGYMPSFSSLAGLLCFGFMEYRLMCFLNLIQKRKTLHFGNAEMNCFEISAFLSY